MYEEWLLENGYDPDILYNEEEIYNLNENLHPKCPLKTGDRK